MEEFLRWTFVGLCVTSGALWIPVVRGRYVSVKIPGINGYVFGEVGQTLVPFWVLISCDHSVFFPTAFVLGRIGLGIVAASYFRPDVRPKVGTAPAWLFMMIVGFYAVFGAEVLLSMMGIY